MGAAIWIEIKGRPLEETADDCAKMNRLADELDELSLRLNVPKLSSFFDYSPMDDLVDAELEYLGTGDDVSDEPEEAPHVADVAADPLAEGAARGEWFDSSQGLTTIRALRSHLAAHADAVELPASSGDDWDRYRRELLEEFEHCERFLSEAVSNGQPFRLLVVP